MTDNILNICFIKHEKYWNIQLDLITQEVIWNDSQNINENSMQLTQEEKDAMEQQIKKWIKVNSLMYINLN